MRKTWKIISYGQVSPIAPQVAYACAGCGNEAYIPVLGLALAQAGNGVIFDSAAYALPEKIQCRACRRIYQSGA